MPAIVSSMSVKRPWASDSDRFDSHKLDASSHAFLDRGWRHQVDTATKRPRQVLLEIEELERPNSPTDPDEDVDVAICGHRVAICGHRVPPCGPEDAQRGDAARQQVGREVSKTLEGFRAVADRRDHDRRSIGQTPHHLGMRRASRQPRPTPSVATSSSSEPSTKRAGDA
jgi:hypothetical protein